MMTIKTLVIALLLVAAVTAGCNQSPNPLESTDVPSGDKDLISLMSAACPAPNQPAPSPLVNIQFGEKSLNCWPFTGDDFSGQPQDPINIIFVGMADPLDIRAALLTLDGNRDLPGVPSIPPFNSVWDDAIGDVQTAYGQGNNWTGSCIQLACGPYEGLRFHLRLFKMGAWTVGNAHLDVIIPGTTDHQVLSWELAERFVIADMMRTGLLDTNIPMMPTDQINPAPFRTIPAMIYNGLPVELRALIEGPMGDVGEDVAINTDGHALVFNLAGKAPRVFETRVQDFVINFNQVIPKPFCASGPYDYVYVAGPVHLYQVSQLSPDGSYQVKFNADGELTATPFDIFSQQPSGLPMSALIQEQHSGRIVGSYLAATSMKYQKLGDLSQSGSGLYFSRLIVRSNGLNGFTETVRCAETTVTAER